MRRMILSIIVVIIIVNAAAIAESLDITEYITGLGFEPTVDDSNNTVCYCNYTVVNNDSSMIEWSDGSSVYSITDNSKLLSQVYINLLFQKEWDSCSYVIAKRSRFSFMPMKKSMHKYDSLGEYIERAEETLGINSEIELYSPMKTGDKGDAVLSLQQRLKEHHYLEGSVDGSFGAKTEKAVKLFQRTAKLEKTGIADLYTQCILFSDAVPEAPQMEQNCSVITIDGYSDSRWNVDGYEFSLKGNETKTLETRWGTYIFYASGDSVKITD